MLIIILLLFIIKKFFFHFFNIDFRFLLIIFLKSRYSKIFCGKIRFKVIFENLKVSPFFILLLATKNRPNLYLFFNSSFDGKIYHYLTLVQFV